MRLAMAYRTTKPDKNDLLVGPIPNSFLCQSGEITQQSYFMQAASGNNHLNTNYINTLK